MAKKFPSAEFKIAVKALNEVLKAEGREVIKFIAVKKTEVVESFTNTILEFIEADKAQDLPDLTINFYNDHIANEEDESDDTGGGTAGSDAKEKPAKEKKAKKAKKEKAPKKDKGPSIVGLVVAMFMKNTNLTKKDIVAEIQDKFPAQKIDSTVSSAMCVLNHVKKHI